MKKYIGICFKIIGIIVAVLLIANIILPFVKKEPDPDYEAALKQTEFTGKNESEEQDVSERIRCIDQNEEALIYRLHMIGSAKESIVLSTFDLRPDDSGTDIIAALYHAADRGVKVKILIDGIYQKIFLEKSQAFRALAARENVEVRIYNPITVTNLTRLNYRMHDKYLIIDDSMYLLGGRNTNDIFLGDKKTGINVDRDIFVYETKAGKGKSFKELETYFQTIWNEKHVTEKKIKSTKSDEEQGKKLETRYQSLKQKYTDIEEYRRWEEDTYAVNKITLLNNGTKAARKSPEVLQAIEYIAEQGKHVRQMYFIQLT